MGTLPKASRPFPFPPGASPPPPLPPLLNLLRRRPSCLSRRPSVPPAELRRPAPEGPPQRFETSLLRPQTPSERPWQHFPAGVSTAVVRVLPRPCWTIPRSPTFVFFRLTILLLLFLMILPLGLVRNPQTIIIQPAICWPTSTMSSIELQQRRMAGASGSSATLRKVHGPLSGPLLSPRPPPQVCTRPLTATTR